MAAFVDSLVYGPVERIEVTDPVVGGAPNKITRAGAANLTGQDLANRTAFLKDIADNDTVRRTGNQSATGIKTFARIRAQASVGQTEPSIEVIGLAGQTNGIYSTAAGLRFGLDGLATLDFGYDNVMRAVSTGAPFQIAPEMLSGLAMAFSGLANGYQRFPGANGAPGLILQYGYQTSNAQLFVDFPIAFPNACHTGLVVSAFTDATRVAAFNINGNPTRFRMNVNQTTVTGGATGFRWIAIGN